jgi:hypothetical protein
MTARGPVHALTIAAVGVALGFGVSAARMLPTAAPCSAATYSGHVSLVVEHGDGRVVGLCIGFDGASITGEQVLQASGVEYATAGYGALGDAVCQIDDEPASYSSCLPSSGPYWAVFVSRGGGAWQEASSGISTETLASGDAEGFRYDPQNGPDPAPASAAGICTAALGGQDAGASASGSGGASGSGAGSGSGGSQSPATTAVPVATVEPSAAVIAPAGGSPHPTSSSTPAEASAAVSPGLIAVAVVVGGLTGLLVVQLWLRRRRV